MQIRVLLLVWLAIQRCSWGSVASTDEKSARGIPGEDMCSNGDCKSLDIRKEIVKAQNLAKMLEQEIADATMKRELRNGP